MKQWPRRSLLWPSLSAATLAVTVLLAACRDDEPTGYTPLHVPSHEGVYTLRAIVFGPVPALRLIRTEPTETYRQYIDSGTLVLFADKTASWSVARREETERPGQATIVVTSTASGTATWRQDGVVLELIYSPSAIDSADVRRDTLRMAQSVGMFGSTPVIYTR